MTDTEIIAQILNGRKELYSHLVEKYQGLVFGVIRRNLPDETDTMEDLAQEVFFKAFRSLARYRGEASFATWLYRITLNCITDHHRRNKTNLISFAEIEQTAVAAAVGHGYILPEPQTTSRETQLTIRKALAALPDAYRQVLFLHHYYGYSYQEISIKLKVPVKTVETRLYRAKQALRRHLEVGVE